MQSYCTHYSAQDEHPATNQIVVTLDARKDTAVFFGSRNRIHADAREVPA